MHPQAMARGQARANRALLEQGAIARRPCARASMPRTFARKFANGTAMAGSFATKKNREEEASAMIPSVNFARGFAACLAVLTWGGIGSASALDYPTRPVRWIVPYTPGGGTDITARIVAQWLSERLGQQFFIENKPGAGNNIGTEAAIHSPPDGYCCWSIRRMRSTRRSIPSCPSISSAIPRRLPASCGCRT